MDEEDTVFNDMLCYKLINFRMDKICLNLLAFVMSNLCLIFADGCAQLSDNVWPDASPTAGQQHLSHGTRQCRPMPCGWKCHQSCTSYCYFLRYLHIFCALFADSVEIIDVHASHSN